MNLSTPFAADDKLSALKEQRLPRLRERMITVLVTSLLFLVVYNGTNYVTAHRLDIGTAVFAWEKHIPYVPLFLIPYWSIDLFFILAPFICRTSAELSLLRKRITIGILIAGTCFLLFPLKMAVVRPQVEGFLGALDRALDNFGNFYNLSPSLHIILRCILWTVYIPATRGLVRWILQGWFLLIGISTLLVWQHHVIDVFTGQLVGLLIIRITAPASKQSIDQDNSINARARIGLRYALLLGILLTLTFIMWLPGVVLLWPAAAVSVVMLAYFGAGPGIFGKRDGKLQGSSPLLLAPYLLFAHLSYLYFTRGKPPYRQILPNLYIGRRVSNREAKELVTLGITDVVDLTAEYGENRILRKLKYHFFPILDLTAPPPEALKEIVSTIDKALDSGKVFVHCSLGRSRTVIATAAYLLTRNPSLTAQGAVDFIQKQLPEVVVRSADLRALHRFALSLRPDGPPLR